MERSSAAVFSTPPTNSLQAVSTREPAALFTGFFYSEELVFSK